MSHDFLDRPQNNVVAPECDCGCENTRDFRAHLSTCAYAIAHRPGGLIASEREATRPRYDLIPKEWLDELASIMEEGAIKYGENSWKNKSVAFYRDCLNHAMDHLLRFNSGDLSENQLPKVAWNVLAYQWAKGKGKV